MKKYLIYFLFFHLAIIIGLFESKAQTPFTWVNNYNTQNWSTMNSVFVTRQNQLIFSSFKTIRIFGNSPIPYPKFTPVLFKTELNGTLITSKEFIRFGDTYVQFLSNVFEADDDSLVLIGDGLHENDSIPSIVFAKCDHNFTLGTVKTYPLLNSRGNVYCSSYLGTSAGGGLFKKHPKGGYYGVVTINSYKLDQFGWQTDSPIVNYYYRFDASGNVLQNGKINLPYYRKRSDVAYSNSLKQYMTADISNESYLLDSTFKLIAYTPTSFVSGVSNESVTDRGANSMTPYKNTHLVVGGYYKDVQLPDLSYFDYGSLCLMVLNDSLKPINKYFITPIARDSGRNKNTADFKAMDYLNEDSIFIAYYPELQAAVWEYTVFMIDSNFKVRWARIDTLQHFTNLTSIKATPDGGCIITGNTAIGFNENMFVIKYDKSGMVSSVKYFEKDMVEITIFPNPGSDKIFISGEQQNKDFIMYDMQGKMVTQAANQQLIKGIDISNLQTGVYFYKITDSYSGAVKCGKWSKQ